MWKIYYPQKKSCDDDDTVADDDEFIHQVFVLIFYALNEKFHSDDVCSSITFECI
jgi:hypothetical protein